MFQILVIDDDQGIRYLLETVFRRKGYDVVLAENGQKGLELFRHKQPDVIVLDLKMPGMDGVAVLQHIRSLNRDQPVIMFTGAWTSKTEQQIRALGITEIVKKEASLHRLEEALKHLSVTPTPALVPSKSWSASS